MAMAVACLGYTPEQFFAMTPRAFQLAMQAFRSREEDQARVTFEAARLTGWLSLKPYLKEGTAPEQVCPLPWDAERPKPEQKPITEELMQRAREKMEFFSEEVEGE